MCEIERIEKSWPSKAQLDSSIFASSYVELEKMWASALFATESCSPVENEWWRVSTLCTDSFKKLTKPKYLSPYDCFSPDAFASTWDKPISFTPITWVDNWAGYETLNFDAELELAFNYTDSKKIFLSFKLDEVTSFLKLHFTVKELGRKTVGIGDYYRTLLEFKRNTFSYMHDCGHWVSPFPFTPILPCLHSLETQVSFNEFKPYVLKTEDIESTLHPVVEIAEELFAYKRLRLIEFAELVESLFRKMATNAVRAVCPIAVRPVKLSSSVEEKEGEQLWPILMAFKNN
jgi:hypothetical protein